MAKITKPNVLLLVAMLAAIAGVFVSFSLLREDVLSTAYTMFDYFPATFSVTPASTWNGAIRLGVFITVMQIVTATIMAQKQYNIWLRVGCFILFFISMPFDSWTDVVYRSDALTGNLPVAISTTFMFYTIGSEVLQSISWIVIFTTWRKAIREGMRLSAQVLEGFRSIRTEWNTIKRQAENIERREIAEAHDSTEKSISSSLHSKLPQAKERTKNPSDMIHQKSNIPSPDPLLKTPPDLMDEPFPYHQMSSFDLK